MKVSIKLKQWLKVDKVRRQADPLPQSDANLRDGRKDQAMRFYDAHAANVSFDARHRSIKSLGIALKL